MRGNIDFQGVSYEFVDRHGAVVRALNDVTLSLHQGEFLAVVGHNGSGKSTLAKHVNALLKPTSGRVLVYGMDTGIQKNVWDIRRSVGYVSQHPDNQIVASTVEEDVAFGPENIGMSPPEIRTRVVEALNAVGMRGFERKAPHLLSGGQKQRLAIAGALALGTGCLIMDEPTSMLDPAGRKEVIDLVLRLCRDNGTCVIFITHFMDEVSHADRVLVMEKGRIRVDCKPKEIFADRGLLEELGLALPTVPKISSYLRQMGLDIMNNPLTRQELVDELCRLNSKT